MHSQPIPTLVVNIKLQSAIVPLSLLHSLNQEIADPFYAYCKLHVEKGIRRYKRQNWLAIQSNQKQASSVNQRLAALPDRVHAKFLRWVSHCYQIDSLIIIFIFQEWLHFLMNFFFYSESGCFKLLFKIIVCHIEQWWMNFFQV